MSPAGLMEGGRKHLHSIGGTLNDHENHVWTLLEEPARPPASDAYSLRIEES